MYKYLSGYDRPKLLGISHESCVRATESLGSDYDLNSSTKYEYQILKHPVENAYCLKIHETIHLEEKYITELKEESQMTLDGWFNYPD